MLDIAQLEAAGLLDDVEDERTRHERVELLQQLLRDGFSLEELQQAARQDRLALLPVERVLHREGARLTPVDVAEQSGLPLDLLRRLWRALGLADASDTEVAFTESDLTAAKTVALFRAAGLGEEPLVLIGQVVGQSMSRLSETLREIAGQALLQAGDSERTLGIRYAQATEQLVPLLAPLLGYVLGVHLKEQIKTDIIRQTELISGRLGFARQITVCFADLVDFTRLGERVPPLELSNAARRLTDMAVDVARPPVRLVKMIGDAALLVSTDPEPLVHAALDIVALADQQSELMPQLRAGIASGQAIPQSGDWYGAPVNLASRVTDLARPGSVLATKPVRDAAEDSFAWSYAGARHLKGVKGDVPLYRVRRKSEAPR